MTIVNFTPIASLAGGALIGLAASLLLLAHGRIMGMSGIYGGLLRPAPGDIVWRLAFVGGVFVGGAILALAAPSTIAGPEGRPLVAVGIAGLLVGFGTRLGNGCTSGHGVCGLTRFSARSLVAVVTFMTTGFLAATLTTALLGGG